MKKYKIQTMTAGNWTAEYESKEDAELEAADADLRWGNGTPSFSVEEVADEEE